MEHSDFTPEQKKAIAAYIQYQLRRNRTSQKQIAIAYGCSESSVSYAINQGPLHQAMPKLKNYIAQKVGRSSWQELCAEALVQ